MTNEKIIEGLKSNSSEVLDFIYQNYYPVIERIILYEYYGRIDDAKDIFQDALITVYTALCSDPPLIIEYKFSTFLATICRRKMIDRTRTDKKNLNIDNVKELKSDSDVLETIIRDDRIRLIEKHFKLLGDRCQELLKLFIYGYSVSDVTVLLKMSSEQLTKTRRLKCKIALFKRLYNDPLLKELSDGKPWTIREIPRW